MSSISITIAVFFSGLLSETNKISLYYLQLNQSTDPDWVSTKDCLTDSKNDGINKFWKSFVSQIMHGVLTYLTSHRISPYVTWKNCKYFFPYINLNNGVTTQEQEEETKSCCERINTVFVLTTIHMGFLCLMNFSLNAGESPVCFPEVINKLIYHISYILYMHVCFASSYYL